MVADDQRGAAVKTYRVNGGKLRLVNCGPTGWMVEIWRDDPDPVKLPSGLTMRNSSKHGFWQIKGRAEAWRHGVNMLKPLVLP